MDYGTQEGGENYQDAYGAGAGTEASTADAVCCIHCGEPIPWKQAGEQSKNPGRWFLSCNKDDGCPIGWFVWQDSQLPDGRWPLSLFDKTPAGPENTGANYWTYQNKKKGVQGQRGFQKSAPARGPPAPLAAKRPFAGATHAPPPAPPAKRPQAPSDPSPLLATHDSALLASIASKLDFLITLLQMQSIAKPLAE